MVKNELKAMMALYGDTQEDLANFLNKTPQSISAKINGTQEFKRPEIEKTAIRYKMTAEDIQRIFFAKTVIHQMT